MRSLPSTGIRRSVALGFVVVAVVLLGARLVAGGQQGSPFAPAQGPFDAILAQLTALTEAVANLQPGTPQPAPVTLATSAVNLPTATFVLCAFTNRGTSPLTNVHVRLLTEIGSVLTQVTVDVNSGATFVLNNNVNVSFFGAPLRCEFTFVGFANDARANMTTASGFNTVPQVVFEAR